MNIPQTPDGRAVPDYSAVFVGSPCEKWSNSVYELGVVLSVDDAVSGLGHPRDCARVLAIEVERLRAQLDECRKMQKILIKNMFEGVYPPKSGPPDLIHTNETPAQTGVA